MGKRWIDLVITIVVALVSLNGNSQQPAASSAAHAAAVAKINPGTLAQVEIISDVDVKKAHAGDLFRTRLWDDIRSGNTVILPHKTILVGHVVEAQPHTKDNSESKLTIAFDKAILKDGVELPLQGVVERVQLSAFSVAAAADANARTYNPGMNPGSTTNVAMPASGASGQDSSTPGPTNIRDTDILVQGDASGKLTVVSSATKADVKLKRFATLDVRITHAGE